MCALNAVMAAGEADRTQSQMIMIGNWLASPNIRAPGRGEIPVEIGPRERERERERDVY